MPKTKRYSELMKERLGLSLKETREKLLELSDEEIEVLDEMFSKGYDTDHTPTGPISKDESAVRTRYRDIDERAKSIREYYMLHLFESLESESKRLNILTLVLICLTCILAILTAFSILRLG